MIRSPFRFTTVEGLAPVGGAYDRNHAALVADLTALVSPEVAAMFADFRTDDQGQRSDWYGPDLPGARIVAFDALAEDERQALLSRLDAGIAAIREAAERQEKRAGASAATLLRTATHYPGTDYLHAVFPPSGGPPAPLLVHWGWKRDVIDTPTGSLTGTKDIAPPPQVMATNPGSVTVPEAIGQVPLASGSAAWVMRTGWVALAAMCAAIVLIMVAPCGLQMGALGADHCPAPAPPAPPGAGVTAMLQDRIAKAELALARAGQDCIAEAGPPPPPALPQTLPDWVDHRLVGDNLGFWFLTPSQAWITHRVSCAPILAVGGSSPALDGQRLGQTIVIPLANYRRGLAPALPDAADVRMLQFSVQSNTSAFERLSGILDDLWLNAEPGWVKRYVVQSRLPRIESCTVEMRTHDDFSGHVDLVVTYAGKSAVRRAYVTAGQSSPVWDDPKGLPGLPYLELDLTGGGIALRPTADRRVILPDGYYPE